MPDERISDNIARIKDDIARAARRAGRNPDEITLICVTKNRTIEEVKEAIGAGISDIGENRVQEALVKFEQLRIKWHMVGHLQTNKAKDAVRIFDLIHSVDTIRVAEAIDREAEKLNKVQNVLVEVNTSGEVSKFGVALVEVVKFFEEIAKLYNIKVRGLMTIAPIVDNPEDARPYFRMLRELCDKMNWRTGALAHQSPVLSMGMSQDYEVAVEEGSNMVRIGRAIFGG